MGRWGKRDGKRGDFHLPDPWQGRGEGNRGRDKRVQKGKRSPIPPPQWQGSATLRMSGHRRGSQRTYLTLPRAGSDTGRSGGEEPDRGRGWGRVTDMWGSQ